MNRQPFKQLRRSLRIVEAVESAHSLNNLPRLEVDHERTRAHDFGTLEFVQGSRSPEALDADDEEALPRFGV